MISFSVAIKCDLFFVNQRNIQLNDIFLSPFSRQRDLLGTLEEWIILVTMKFHLIEILFFFQARKYQTKMHKFVDPLLRAKQHGCAQIMECVKVALLCIHHHAKHRPSMSEVVTMLGSIIVAQ